MRGRRGVPRNERSEFWGFRENLFLEKGSPRIFSFFIYYLLSLSKRCGLKRYRDPTKQREETYRAGDRTYHTALYLNKDNPYGYKYARVGQCLRLELKKAL